MSDYPSRLRSMADFSPQSGTITKIIPQGATFLRETAKHIETLERIVYLYCDPMAVPDEDAKIIMAVGRKP